MTGQGVDRRSQGADAPGGGRWDEVAVRLGRIARALQDQDNAQDTLDEVVRAAVRAIPGARHAGIMMVVDEGAVRTVARTSDLVDLVEQVQCEVGQGPGLDSLHRHLTVTVADLRAETRWPAFATGAGGLGVLSVLSFQLFVSAEDLGALTLYSPEPGAFDQESVHVGQLFATHAAVALAAARREEQLTEAMRTRDLIGQAKGILMERHKLSANQAFAVLVRSSQYGNTKLHDVADHLVRTGHLPTEAHRAP
ncbi:GAF and ANTAR domain-containing protein [Saccharothrix longispora]|uniref:GAF and ANTAR domain-containing protein n=1 Tax=Saccharothrix longispora TaxID=33920 RepID=UPI0028FDA758|nr:GAF and ANTAR domain-containing protein [Saccharothrix longispora]MDU0294508.1 GAF and ANTAR domain-containing protein [Saccharothrix longispora]